MTTTKQYWLGTAALVLAATSAQAADLPFRKAAPVEYVRVCDAFGAGFFYIPGTDTCLRVAGQVRAEETFRIGAPTNNPAAFAYNAAGQVYRRDLTNFRARGYLNLDSRTQTAYGALRAFVSIRVTNDTTSPGPLGGRGGGQLIGSFRASTGYFQGGPAGSFTVMDKGFIQFAGITAGRSQSFFDFDAQSVELLTNSVANSNEVTELLAYTATFGGGFSATVSVENPSERRTGDNGAFTYGGGVNPSPFGAGFTPNNPVSATVAGGNLSVRDGVLAYGGTAAPDVVANLRYDGDWGSAQISGAYHELRSIPVTTFTSYNTATGAATTGANFSPSAAGFAVLGGVKVLLPTIAKGDSITVQGTYTSGAMDYANSNNYFNGLSGIYANNVNNGVPVNDAFVNINGKIEKSEAYGGYANFKHYWVPEVSSALYGAYLQINNPVNAQKLGNGFDNARIYQIGLNTIWTPVKDMQIGAEGLYSNMLYSGLATFVAGPNTAVKNPDDFRLRVSLRRAF